MMGVEGMVQRSSPQEPRGRDVWGSLERRVLHAVQAFDAEAPGLLRDVVDLFSGGVVLSEEQSSRLWCLHFDVQETMDRLHPGWDRGLEDDRAAAAIERGLRFVARVERRRLWLATRRIVVDGGWINPQVLEGWWRDCSHGGSSRLS